MHSSWIYREKYSDSLHTLLDVLFVIVKSQVLSVQV